MKTWECIAKTIYDNQLILPGETVTTPDDVELGKHVFKLVRSENPGNSQEPKKKTQTGK